MAETEEAKVVRTVPGKVKEEEGDGMESQIKRAMRSRVSFFKEQADSLTFEGVRRLLENDMGLDSNALDVHKRLVKDCLLKCLDKDDDANGSESSSKIEEKNVAEGEGAAAPIKELSNDIVKEASSENEEKMDDSPVMGLLSRKKKTEVQDKKVESTEKKEAPSESTIKEAILKRASYLKANSETITMAGARRLLEEDLQLDKNTLLPFKKFITEHVDEVLKMPAVAAPAASSGKKKISNKSSQRKASKKINTKDSFASSTSGSEEMEDEGRTKSKAGTKRKASTSEETRKLKRPAKETKVSSKKQSKLAEKSDQNSDSNAGGSASEDDQSQLSTEKSLKKAQKKEIATPTYGKRVEHLKSIIKSCGMSVPPAVYKRAKQVSENKREAALIKELEDILSREGLSADPSEKEIKEVKKRKDRAKELEGIDMSNIVSSTRRRSTTSFAPPPKPKVPVKDGTEDAEDTDSSSNNGDDDEDGSDSPSEELNQDDDDENSD